MVRLLSVLQGELIVAGDLPAARVARDAIDQIAGLVPTAGEPRAEVLELARRRRREDG